MELFEKHPCFNEKARHRYGRIHLPVAPRCNIQCKFCNREYDCVNESRPGVTSGVLSPQQALAYLDEIVERQDNLAVMGIAGPGDPFANPEETMETLRLVREAYPEMLLCLATNGLNIGPYIDELATMNVSHVTITVNAVDPEIGAKIYSWVRFGKRNRRAREGAEILLEQQLAAIKALKAHGITVKINSILLPGINDDHIEEIAKLMAEMRVDIFNCIPYYKNAGSAFADLDEPDPEVVKEIRDVAAQYLPQMHHCTRCRADAVGLLGAPSSSEFMKLLQQYEKLDMKDAPKPVSADETRPYVAVASMEGMLINQHLGEAENLLIYQQKNGEVELLERRKTPPTGGGMQRWKDLAGSIQDCRALLVSGIGGSPQKVLAAEGVEVMVVEGLIDDAVGQLFQGNDMSYLMKREKTACGAACSGSGGGCG